MSTDPALVDALETCRAAWDPKASAPTREFDALLERWPDDPAALIAAGTAHDDIGDTATAIHCYRLAQPGLAGTELRRSYLRLGDALRRTGRLDDAISVLEDGLEEFPGSRSLRTFLALALHEQGRKDAALGLVLEVLVDPTASPDLELFRPAVRERAKHLFDRDRAA